MARCPQVRGGEEERVGESGEERRGEEREGEGRGGERCYRGSSKECDKSLPSTPSPVEAAAPTGLLFNCPPCPALIAPP